MPRGIYDRSKFKSKAPSLRARLSASPPPEATPLDKVTSIMRSCDRDNFTEDDYLFLGITALEKGGLEPKDLVAIWRVVLAKKIGR